MRREGGRHFGKEDFQILVIGVLHILEIHRHALQLVGGEKSDDLVQQGGAARRVGQQLAQLRSIPLPARGVLQHGQDGDIGLAGADIIERTLVEIGFEIEVGPVQIQPAGDHPVQPRQVALERRKAGIRRAAPIDVKTHCQGAALLRLEHGRHPHRHGGAEVAQAPVFQPPGAGLGRQLRGGLEQARRDSAGDELGRIDRHRTARQINIGGGRGDQQAGNKADTQKRADDGRTPAQDREARRAPARNIEKYRFVGHCLFLQPPESKLSTRHPGSIR